MMKKLLSITALALIAAVSTNAQSWTANDWEGNAWSIDDYNEQAVLVDISAHWCSPCWAWHQSQIMEELYHDFGPDATGEFMVFFIDGDNTSTVAELTGSGSTQGDWTAGTPYPLIGPNGQGGSVASNYNFGGYPTLFLHCGMGTAPEIARQDKWSFWEDVMACSDAFDDETDDATVLIDHTVRYICDGSADFTVPVYNAGTNALTSFEVELRDPTGTLVHTQAFSGKNIAHGQHEVVSVAYQSSQVGTWSAKVIQPNGNVDPRPNGDEEQFEVALAPAGNDAHITVEVITDNYGSETTWELVNQYGDVILSGGPYTDGGSTTNTAEAWVNNNGCYTFRIWDAYGDGICCAYGNGSYKVMQGSDVILQGGQFASSETQMMEVDAENVGVEEMGIEELRIQPSVTDGDATLIFSLADNSNVNIEVRDAMGKTVANVFSGQLLAGPQRMNVSLQGLAAGHYLVSITGDAGQVSKRVVKY